MAANPNILYFRPGQHVFKEGEPSKAMYLVQKGTLSVRKMKGSVHVEIARIYSNEVLGELSFFDRMPRSASALALTEVELLEIRFDSLDPVYDKVPAYLKTIVAAVAERLRRANDTIRRLQKNVIRSDGSTSLLLPGEDGTESEPPKSTDEMTAADVLASLGTDLAEANLSGTAPAAAPGSGSSEDPEKSG
jgi:CRP-like cAMP-binding protein